MAGVQDSVYKLGECRESISELCVHWHSVKRSPIQRSLRFTPPIDAGLALAEHG